MRRKRRLLLAVVLPLVAAGSCLFTIPLISALLNMYVPPAQEKSKEPKAAPLTVSRPTALLLVGVDERPGDRGRADTIMVAAIHPKRRSVLLAPVPRDTLVRIPGRPLPDKVNHSYAHGGMELTRETVEQLLDLPIDGTVKVNMTGLKETVDAVGGIDVNVPFPFTYDGVRFERGTMHLDGKEALAFVRMRKADPLGDLGRIKRQQAVIRALIRKGSGLNSLPQWPIIMSRLGDHVKTDLPPLTFLRLQMWLSGIEEDEIRTVQLPGRGIRWRGLYYFHPDEGGLRQVREKLKRQLEP